MQSPKTLLTFLVFVATLWTKSGGHAQTYGMDNKATCLADGIQMKYIEDGKSASVVGKNTLVIQQATTKVCKIKFKPLSKKGRDYLSLKFESFYINNCGITLTIDQSPDSTFEQDVAKLVHLQCEQASPRILYAKKDYTVQITLSREDIYLRNYNFRINVSLSEGPPKTGPSVAVIIGISAALIAVIAVIAFILIKYIRLKNSVLRERRAERAIESALYVYNSQELDRQDRGLNTPVPGQTLENGANTHTGAHRNGGIHSTNSQDERRSLLTVNQNNSRTNGHMPQSIDVDVIPPEYCTESKGSLDLEGDMPPSYEEALEMPKPPDSPIYANA
ncbi:uncharacterized protein [Haliotis asinina]|uniref:uncharacterized protein n=1 Tax=Haliotis asinina TaxID=109174 RepID=UPI003531C01C